MKIRLPGPEAMADRPEGNVLALVAAMAGLADFVAPGELGAAHGRRPDSGTAANLPAGQMLHPSLFWPQDEPVAQPAGHFKHCSTTLSARG